MINHAHPTAKRYRYYRDLIPMSWAYTRPLRLHVRMSQETRVQMDAIREAMHRANPSDADVVAWAISLLHRHMSINGDHLPPSDQTHLPKL
jgi:hypothetical protein